jgi:RHH-type proline utilization regulon transcriptional repressor/proline dehydrogenase/delta 1-pyrroline-5-carboxylate dehydrogenase
LATATLHPRQADATASARAEIPKLHRAPEPDVLALLLRDAALDADSRRRVEGRALGMLAELRSAQSSGWVNQFLQEYRLNTSEGIALLSLAEAFLRVPDPETADDLIADKLGNADWRAHAGQVAFHARQLGDLGTGDRPRAGKRDRAGERAEAPSLPRGRALRASGGRAAMRMMGEIFVMGRTIDEAIGRMRKRENRGFTASFDMLGEAARTFPDAQRYFQAYEGAIHSVGKVASEGHSISVKLSALHPRYEVAQYDRCVPALIEQVEALATLAKRYGIAFTIDAEESERLEMSLDIIEAVAGLPALNGWDGLGMAVQAYGKRCRPTLAWANALGASTGRRIAVRLVKGAYWDSEIKHTPGAGPVRLPAVHAQGGDGRLLPGLRARHVAGANIYPAFATHNALTVATILEWAGESRDFEFQRPARNGRGSSTRALVREQGYHTRIYAPVGGHRDLLAYPCAGACSRMARTPASCTSSPTRR